MIKEARDGGSITPALMEYLVQTATTSPTRLEMLSKTTVTSCSWHGTHWQVQLSSGSAADLEFDCIVLATGRYVVCNY
jgi:cation diffusion facilitator CzcD-associated flavoprotein CzcO